MLSGYGNLKESAAALYVNHRPLTSILGVLKDSIDEPVKQGIPLFSSEMWHVLRALSRPSHKAYFGAIRYVLWQPAWEWDDCTGVVHLMTSPEVDGDPASMQYLALDVIERRLWPRHDHVVARKQRALMRKYSKSKISPGQFRGVRDRPEL